MKCYISLLLLSVISIYSTDAQDLTVEEYNPTSTLVVEGKPVLKAKFPFIDIHGHQYQMADQDLTPVVAAMDTLNMKIMVNLSGRTGDYLERCVDNITTNFPNRFVVFANIDFDGIGSKGWTEKTVLQLEEDCNKTVRSSPGAVCTLVSSPLGYCKFIRLNPLLMGWSISGISTGW